MEPAKIITKIFTHFTDIINDLKSLGKSYSNSELMRKIFRSAYRAWEAKVMAIQEAKDLNTLSLEELLDAVFVSSLFCGVSIGSLRGGISLLLN